MKHYAELDEERLNLETEISKTYDYYLKEHKYIPFHDLLEEDKSNVKEVVQEIMELGEEYDLPMVEFRNEITGNVFDIFVLYVDENGIHFFQQENKDMDVCKFSDLADVRDRLTLIEEFEMFNEDF